MQVIPKNWGQRQKSYEYLHHNKEESPLKEVIGLWFMQPFCHTSHTASTTGYERRISEKQEEVDKKYIIYYHQI
jgi:hypothetical protein